MEIFEQKSVDVIQAELDDRKKQMEHLARRREVLQADMDGFETPGYEAFKVNVLGKERTRLALLRMTIDPDKVNLHERLQGQFNEVEMLMRMKEDIHRDLTSTQRMITEVSMKIQRLQKQLKKRTERA
jgi:conjugal transfer/entry exclusion protein